MESGRFGIRAEGGKGRLLTSREAARRLSISERTLYSLRKAGEITAVHVGKRGIRFTGDALDEYIERASEKK